MEQRVVTYRLRGGAEGVLCISQSQYKHLRQLLAPHHDDDLFLVFDAGNRRYAINPDHLIFCHLLFEAPADKIECSEDQGERDCEVYVWLADSPEPLSFSVEPDAVSLDDAEAAADGDCQLQDLFYYAENGTVTRFAFTDEDGEEVFVRVKDVAMFSAPLLAVEPKLRAAARAKHSEGSPRLSSPSCRELEPARQEEWQDQRLPAEDNQALASVALHNNNNEISSSHGDEGRTPTRAFIPTAQKMVYALDRLLEQHMDMTVLQAKIFFFIAANPGTTQRGVSKHMRPHAASTVSRAMLLLSDVGLRGQEGLGLIQFDVNPVDRREKLMWLSPKGERLVEQIAKDLAPSPHLSSSIGLC